MKKIMFLICVSFFGILFSQEMKNNKLISDFLDDYSTSKCLVMIYPKEAKIILNDAGLSFYETEMPINREGLEILKKLIFNYAKNYKVDSWDGNPTYIGHCFSLKSLNTYKSLKNNLLSKYLMNNDYLKKWIKDRKEESSRVTTKDEKEMFK